MICHRIFLTILLAAPFVSSAQSPCNTTHLTIFDANLAEFLVERTLDLQAGPNSIEWRSLMPQAFIRTIRVTAGDGVTVARQDVTYDGPDVRNQKSPVLHLLLQNSGAAGPRKVRIDYLAPGLSWKGDYALLLGAPATSGSPGEMQLDGWVTVQNETGADICAGSVDLVAGEVQLLLSGSNAPRTFTYNAQSARIETGAIAPGDSLAEVTAMSIFSRSASAATSRWPPTHP